MGFRSLCYKLLLIANSGLAFAADPIVTESTTRSTVVTEGNMTTTVKSPPPSAISPQISAGSNSDLCTVGVAGAVQTQILGISMGTTYTESQCVLLKQAKTLYDMGMKVAAVSRMCQDPMVFQAMIDAGTPCPYEGMIGQAAKAGWESNPDRIPTVDKKEEGFDDDTKKIFGIGSVLGALGMLLIF